jgi:hypothetical protein
MKDEGGRMKDEEVKTAKRSGEEIRRLRRLHRWLG